MTHGLASGMLPLVAVLWLTAGLLDPGGSSSFEPRSGSAGFALLDSRVPDALHPPATLVQAPAPPPLPGTPAPAHVVQELQAALAQAVRRFDAKDAGGVLAHVSEQYRTSPLTKASIRAQLVTVFEVYEAVRARVRIDAVRMVGDQAWIYSTGEVLGLLPLFGSWMTLLQWEGEPEVARKEQGAWRLIGFQQ